MSRRGNAALPCCRVQFVVGHGEVAPVLWLLGQHQLDHHPVQKMRGTIQQPADVRARLLSASLRYKLKKLLTFRIGNVNLPKHDDLLRFPREILSSLSKLEVIRNKYAGRYILKTEQAREDL
jgi:hypothetical protein